MTKTIKIIITILLSALIIGGLALAINTTDQKKEDLESVTNELLILKNRKQECLDSLSYQEAIEEYKGIHHCNLDDERIVELKTDLTAILSFDYENVDKTIEEKKIQNITTVDELVSFLQTE